MAFDWMQTGIAPRRRSGDADRRITMYRQELVDRAELLSRLGYAPSKTISRLQANVAWDFDGPADRPKGLAAKDVADIVKAVYLRRPSR